MGSQSWTRLSDETITTVLNPVNLKVEGSRRPERRKACNARFAHRWQHLHPLPPLWTCLCMSVYTRVHTRVHACDLLVSAFVES